MFLSDEYIVNKMQMRLFRHNSFSSSLYQLLYILKKILKIEEFNKMLHHAKNPKMQNGKILTKENIYKKLFFLFISVDDVLKT